VKTTDLLGNLCRRVLKNVKTCSQYRKSGKDRLRQHRQQRMMAVAPLAPGVEPLARPFLLAFPAEHRRIQIQRETLGRATEQQEQPAPERPPERLDVGLGKPEEEVADGVIARKTLQSQHRMQDVVGA